MRIHEIKAIQPLTPEKARINALKQAKERAADALATEKNRQKQALAQDKLAKAQRDLAKTKLTSK